MAGQTALQVLCLLPDDVSQMMTSIRGIHVNVEDETSSTKLYSELYTPVMAHVQVDMQNMQTHTKTHTHTQT